VAYAPHRRVDVRALDVDFYLLSLYKVYGPHLGLMYVRRELQDRLASRNHFFIGPEEGSYRYEPGNVNHELTAALPAIPEYLSELGRRSGGEASVAGGFEAIAAHEEVLAAPVLEFLAGRDGVRIVGEAASGPDRAPTISFVVPGRDAAEIPTALDAERVAIRYGHFYAYRAIERMGLLEANGVVRISMVHYNTLEEVDRLIAALDAVL
jgi:selenocysteine lyase/cysteine desulfurase